MSIKSLSNYTVQSRYSRYIPDKQRRETWAEAVKRVFDMHRVKYAEAIEKSPELGEMIDWTESMQVRKRVLASQRSLQFGGSSILRHNLKMFNCLYTHIDRHRVFAEIMFSLLCGCGVGFSVQKQHVSKLPLLKSRSKEKITYVVEDSIEGWADAIGVLMNSFFQADKDLKAYWGKTIEFDYSLIRPEGALIANQFKAPGPQGLKSSINKIENLILSRFAGKTKITLSPIDAYDIIMHISDAVLSGGVRRSATICIFSHDDESMMNAKTGNWFSENPQRARSNNSAALLKNKTSREDFAKLMKSTKEFGEPAFVWLDDLDIGYNPSLRKGTQILTRDGIIPIEELQDKDFEVRNLFGNWEKATCRLSGRNKKLIKLRLGNKHDYYATEEHKWPVLHNKGFIKKKTLDLKRGDKIPANYLPSLCEDSGKGDYSDGFLIGWLYGDGSITDRKDGRRQYNFIVSDEDDANGNISEIIISKLNLLKEEHEREINWSKRGKCLETCTTSPSIKKYMDSFFVDKKEFGLPKSLFDFSFSEEFRKGFIDALISSDGSVFVKENGGEITLSTAKRQMADDFVELMGFYGFFLGLDHRKIQNPKFPNQKEYDKIYHNYRIRFYQNGDIYHFRKNFRLSHTGKQKKLQSIKLQNEIYQNQRFISVSSVDDSGLFEDVWDIGVFDETHCFQLSHCVTGNCVEIGMYPKTRDGRSGFQSCNLTEINGKWCDSEQSFLEACEASAIIGTLQAGYTDVGYLSKESKEIFEEEALLGCSITGMMDNPNVLFDPKIQRKGAQTILRKNEEVAALIGIKPAARATAVKPAGCQKADTLVSTEDGILRLDEIGDVDGNVEQDHDISVCTDRKTKKSTKFFVNGKQKTKNIQLDSGLSLESTYDHKYKIITPEGDYLWKKAGEIKDGDVLPYSLGEYKGGSKQKLNSIDCQFNKFTPKYQIKHIKQPKFIDEDFAWFLGVYYGDGSNHKNSIRISINFEEQKGVDKILRILSDKFNVKGIVYEDDRENHCGGYVNIASAEFVAFLAANDLLKPKADGIAIPKIIRCSSKAVIESFIDGYAVADECDKSQSGQSYYTVSKVMADQLVCVLRAIGRDCKMRLMPPTKSSYGNKMRYWIQERKSIKGDITKLDKDRQKIINNLRKHDLNNHFADKVVLVEESECLTYDLEVDDTHTYLANSYISHNSTSCVLGTASGIHPHHAKRYIRRVQANKSEFCLQKMMELNPISVEESVWSANKTDMVISFLCEVPAGVITKNQLSAVELLEKVKLTQQNWIEFGTREASCVFSKTRHNVSNTVTVKPEEWDDVEKFIFDNQNLFAGISLLPSSGDLDYPQAPFSTVLTPNELVREYGDASVFASGLVVDGLAAFDNNLWVACDSVLGLNQLEECGAEPQYPKSRNFKDLSIYFKDREKYDSCIAKQDWVRRVKQFSKRYFDGDTKRTTHCLKHVSLWKTWCDLKREYVEIDWSEQQEERESHVSADTLGAAACSGGSCELT